MGVDAVQESLGSESVVTSGHFAGQPAGHLLPAARPLDRRWVTAALMLAMVLASMEQTVTSTAMPTIIGSLHGLEHYAWVASIYLLACTVSMPLYGRLADTIGRKRVILFAMGLFVVSSVACSFAHSMIQLIIFRGLQGLGAGGTMPVVLTIIGDLFTLEQRAKVQGLFSAVWGTASLAGPALGYLLLKMFGWPSIFYVNLPFGLIAFSVLAWKYHDVEKPHKVDLDLPGAAMLAIGCMALLAMVSRLGPGGWPASVSVSLGLIALLALAIFVWVEHHASNPIMPIDLLMHRAIGPSLLGSLLVGLGALSLDIFVPLYVQGGQGGGAGAAASVVTPVMMAWAVSGVIAAPLVVRWGFRRVAMLGTSLGVFSYAGLLACCYFSLPRPILIAVLVFTGLGFGPASMTYLLSAQNAVAWRQRGMVTSSLQFFRTMGGAVGIGLLGALFNIIAQPQLKTLVSHSKHISAASLLDPHTRETLPPELLAQAGKMISGGLWWVFVAMFISAVAGAVVATLLPKQKADHKVSAMEAAEYI